MKIVYLILLCFFSLTTLAHQGHGESSAFSHDLDHALLTFGVAAVISLAIFALSRNKR